MRFLLSFVSRRTVAAGLLLAGPSLAHAQSTFDFASSTFGAAQAKGSSFAFTSPTLGTIKAFATDSAATQLFVKRDGGAENGLGLTCAASRPNAAPVMCAVRDHEITNPYGILLDLTGVRGTVGSISLGSISTPEGYTITQSMDGVTFTPFAMATGAASNTTTIALSGQRYLRFTAASSNASNYLIGSAAVAAVPEPSTWALMGMGLLSLSGVAVRRRRSAMRA